MVAKSKAKLSKLHEVHEREVDSETQKHLEEEERVISAEYWCLGKRKRVSQRKSMACVTRSSSLWKDVIQRFNPEVEKLILHTDAKNKAKGKDETLQLGVSDEEMARRYETLIETIRKRHLATSQAFSVTVEKASTYPEKLILYPEDGLKRELFPLTCCINLLSLLFIFTLLYLARWGQRRDLTCGTP
ncbi:M-phase phosphoprotein 6-like [Castor canadensis]|uniref:M-phase phosphoprotein 6-like n=1 Tax=Castor canadensis TaxID=51338 RepID=A0AC58JXA3_CASCN